MNACFPRKRDRFGANLPTLNRAVHLPAARKKKKKKYWTPPGSSESILGWFVCGVRVCTRAVVDVHPCACMILRVCGGCRCARACVCNVCNLTNASRDHIIGRLSPAPEGVTDTAAEDPRGPIIDTQRHLDGTASPDLGSPTERAVAEGPRAAPGSSTTRGPIAPRLLDLAEAAFPSKREATLFHQNTRLGRSWQIDVLGAAKPFPFVFSFDYCAEFSILSFCLFPALPLQPLGNEIGHNTFFLLQSVLMVYWVNLTFDRRKKIKITEFASGGIAI